MTRDVPEAEFGLVGAPSELPGGVTGVLRFGDVVVKPVTDVAAAEWTQSVFAELPAANDVRWLRPMPSHDGRWVVDGWIANEFLPGLTAVAPDWATVIEFGGRFHAATQAIRPPAAMLLARAHRWARGERHAFDEQRYELTPEAAAIDAVLEQWCAPDPIRHRWCTWISPPMSSSPPTAPDRPMANSPRTAAS